MIMEDMEKQKSGNAPENGPSEEKKDFVFIREEIKNRPVNRGKLARSTLISAVSALVFGLVACITFAVLLPFATGYFEKDTPASTEQQSTQVIFPEETAEEEMNPEDMLQTPEPEINIEEITAAIEEEEIKNIVDNIEYKFTLNDYQEIFEDLAAIADEAEKAIVRVRTVAKERDWFDTLLEESTEVPGVIVASNESNLYVLTYTNMIDTSEEIYITFANDISIKGFFRANDPRTGLGIIAVPDIFINQATRQSISVAKLGSSNSSLLSGALVLAVGSPMGNYGSMNFGMITSYGNRLNIPDNCYKQITTDIYGTVNSGGVLINLKGEVVGIINWDYADRNAPNLITAFGISELKKTMEKMINNQDLIHLGVTAIDVPSEARTGYGAPAGAFVVSVEMDSPAMRAGIQAGDIIVGIGSKTIASSTELVAAIRDLAVGEEMTVNVVRYSQEEYKELSFSAVPEALGEKDR